MEAKVWWRSRTVWFNVVTFLVTASAMTEFQAALPATALRYIVALQAIGNFFLRFFVSKGPITATQEKAEELNDEQLK